MVLSRIGRFEERKLKKRILFAVVGSIALVLFVVIFGLKLLVGFSLFVDNIRGTTPAATNATQNIIIPPTLDPLPPATNSATLRFTGKGQTGFNAILYLNEVEKKRVTVDKDGSFSATVSLKEGANALSAKLTDDRGNTSDLSNVLAITLKKAPPILEISTPEDNATVTGESNLVKIEGKTEEDTTITVNDRLVVVGRDGAFSYEYPLNQGDNILKVTATDMAGNQTSVERAVKYQK